MTKTLNSEEPEMTELFAVTKEEDLQLGSMSSIYPPPSNGKCQCCGRHLSQIKPFDRGDCFDGSLLVKNYRLICPFNEELGEITEEFFGDCHSGKDYEKASEKLIEKYGEEAAIGIMIYDEMSKMVNPRWNCRDCIRLSDKRYYRLLDNLYKPKGLSKGRQDV